jgi:hypothetical protein
MKRTSTSFELLYKVLIVLDDELGDLKIGMKTSALSVTLA